MDDANPQDPEECLLLFLLSGWLICVLEERWWGSSGNFVRPGSLGICHHLCVEVVFQVRTGADQVSFSDFFGEVGNKEGLKHILSCVEEFESFLKL